jgi:hypothetical protein
MTLTILFFKRKNLFFSRYLGSSDVPRLILSTPSPRQRACLPVGRGYRFIQPFSQAINVYALIIL